MHPHFTTPLSPYLGLWYLVPTAPSVAFLFLLLSFPFFLVLGLALFSFLQELNLNIVPNSFWEAHIFFLSSLCNQLLLHLMDALVQFSYQFFGGSISGLFSSPRGGCLGHSVIPVIDSVSWSGLAVPCPVLGMMGVPPASL